MSNIKDFLTIEEIAQKIGVLRRSVDRYKVRGQMPKPDLYVGRTPLWNKHTIDHWIATRPKPGRPPKQS